MAKVDLLIKLLFEKPSFGYQTKAVILTTDLIHEIAIPANTELADFCNKLIKPLHESLNTEINVINFLRIDFFNFATGKYCLSYRLETGFCKLPLRKILNPLQTQSEAQESNLDFSSIGS
jgi:hypothetical protein